MRSITRRRTGNGKRTSYRAMLSGGERRRLLQLGASLTIFLFALLGRSAFPQKLEQWSTVLRGDLDLSAALTRFEESTTRGEPFLDALGELCIEVLASEVNQEMGESEEKKPLPETAPDWRERRRIWNEFRESQWRA